MLIIGIDPGLSGAIALVNGTTGRLYSVHDLPTKIVRKKTRLDLEALDGMLPAYSADDAHAVVELVGSMPRQGVASAFNFGFTTGAIHGLLTAHGIAIHPVPPQVWKFSVGLRAVPDAVARDRKNASRQLASQLFPGDAHRFARAKDDGRAEAALLAWYGAHKLQL